MKTIILSFLIALALVFFYSCSKTEAAKQPDVTVCSLMLDETDPLLSLPTTSGIESIFGALKQNHASGAIFRSSMLSDVQYTPETQIEIKSVSLLLSNPGERNIEVNTFFSQLDQSVNALRAVPEGKPYSELYVPIATEANYLMSIPAPASNRKLLVYSNLYENSFYSVYRTSDRAMLENNPEKVESIFQQKLPLKNLTSLHVYFIYQPTNYTDGLLYTQISNVYLQMFQKAGATVTISANLTN